jgi:hypothetical protein
MLKAQIIHVESNSHHTAAVIMKSDETQIFSITNCMPVKNSAKADSCTHEFVYQLSAIDCII